MIGVALYIFPYWFRSAFSTAAWVLSSLIFISAVASWIPQVRDTKGAAMLVALTEPVVAPVRSLLSHIPALAQLPLDFSPVITFFLINLLRDIVVSL